MVRDFLFFAIFVVLYNIYNYIIYIIKRKEIVILLGKIKNSKKTLYLNKMHFFENGIDILTYLLYNYDVSL